MTGHYALSEPKDRYHEKGHDQGAMHDKGDCQQPVGYVEDWGNSVHHRTPLLKLSAD